MLDDTFDLSTFDDSSLLIADYHFDEALPFVSTTPSKPAWSPLSISPPSESLIPLSDSDLASEAEFAELTPSPLSAQQFTANALTLSSPSRSPSPPPLPTPTPAKAVQSPLKGPSNVMALINSLTHSLASLLSTFLANSLICSVTDCLFRCGAPSSN